MNKTIKENLEESVEVTSLELKDNISLPHNEVMQKLQEIKLTEEILAANEKHEQELKISKKKIDDEKQKSDARLDLEKRKLELEEQKFLTECSNNDRDYLDKKEKERLELEESNKNKKKEILKNVGKGFLTIAKGVGKTIIALAPVALYTWCYANDTYYERYENGIARHSAKDVLKEVLKPAPKIGKN